LKVKPPLSRGKVLVSTLPKVVPLIGTIIGLLEVNSKLLRPKRAWAGLGREEIWVRLEKDPATRETGGLPALPNP
jgi:hypothetical protein